MASLSLQDWATELYYFLQQLYTHTSTCQVNFRYNEILFGFDWIFTKFKGKLWVHLTHRWQLPKWYLSMLHLLWWHDEKFLRLKSFWTQNYFLVPKNIFWAAILGLKSFYGLKFFRTHKFLTRDFLDLNKFWPNFSGQIYSGQNMLLKDNFRLKSIHSTPPNCLYLLLLPLLPPPPLTYRLETAMRSSEKTMTKIEFYW